LSQAEYLGNLYDIGFDKPETHLIKKSDTLFYAFYDKTWEGSIKLKGLEKTKKYVVFDYENNKKLGTVNGNNPVLKTKFEDHLLIEVYPLLEKE
jgi:alpha-galactosidase